MGPFKFTITAKDKKSRARTGIIQTRHGKLETPYLVPVATRGKIIALSHKEIKKLNPQAMLANTYHLHFMPPGDKAIKRAGGLHKYMKFPKILFTDSGGFQALSLGVGRVRNMRKIGFIPGKNKIINNKLEESFAKMTDKGIIFTSTYNEKIKRFVGPEESMKIQSNLGSDIIMAFDQCNCAGDTKEETEEAMLRSHEWELESLEYKDKKQALYGIIHGGTFRDLRIDSAKYILSLPFDGIAIGGSLGKSKEEMYKILNWVVPIIDRDSRPRHMLGIGWIEDIFRCVELGMDTFDCVETTRVARHGNLYVSPKSSGNVKNKFRISIRKSIYKKDNKKIDSNCNCPTCKKYRRKHLHELYKAKDPKFNTLATIHNLHFMENLTKSIRKAIKSGIFQKLKEVWLEES